MVERLREGDQQAFDTFYWQYIDQVASYFMKRTQSAYQAEELTQLTFIKFWEYRGTLNDDIAINIQLFYKARLIYIDWLRRESTKRKILSELIVTGFEAPNKDEDPNIEKAKNALNSLPEMRRKVVTLFYLEGYSYKEISEMLQISTKTVDNHLYKGVGQLRKALLCLILFFNQ